MARLIKKVSAASVTLIIFASLGFFVAVFQNCAPPVNFGRVDASSYDAQGRRIYTGQMKIEEKRVGPPLDLFFIVDNSGSMLPQQTNLKNNMTALFDQQSKSLSSLDTNIYVFSMASSVNGNNLNQNLLPNRDPASLKSIPSASDILNLYMVPGNVFSFWKNQQTNFVQFSPAPVMGQQGAVLSSSILMPKRADGQSDADYKNILNQMKSQFQARLDYLNPNYQLDSSAHPVSVVTDTTSISSGLCSYGRIVNHAKDFVKPGDSSAFVLLSDDNDRLNDRNASGSQCIESIGTNPKDGSCSSTGANFQYSTLPSVSYHPHSQFNYNTGTEAHYIVETNEDCTTQTFDGYNYSFNVTVQVPQDSTTANFTVCTSTVDSVCTATSSASQSFGGNILSVGKCPADIANRISGAGKTPDLNYPIACSYQYVAPKPTDQYAGSGVDAGSDGQSCSQALISLLRQQNSNYSSCSVGAAHTKAATVNGQAPGYCASYCSAHTNSTTSCSTNVNHSGWQVQAYPGVFSPISEQKFRSDYASIAAQPGFQFIGSNPVGAGTLTVNRASQSNGQSISCSSSLTDAGISITNSSGSAVCAGASSVASCLQSLSLGNCAPVDEGSGDLNFLTSNPNMNCQSACDATTCGSTNYSSVGNYIAVVKGGSCVGGVSNSSNQGLNLNFASSNGISCDSLCESSLQGSCGNGAKGSIANYIKTNLNGTCTGVSTNQSQGPHVVDAKCPSNYPIFSASNAVTTSFVNAKDSNHQGPDDYIQYLHDQTSTAIGLNNTAVAVITQVSGETLAGDFVGSERPVEGVAYEKFAKAMQPDSPQLYGITKDYSQALGNISKFIVSKTSNSFILNEVDSKKTFLSLQIQKMGQGEWKTIDASKWTFLGQTLSLDPSVGGQIGDVLRYNYRDQQAQ